MSSDLTDQKRLACDMCKRTVSGILYISAEESASKTKNTSSSNIIKLDEDIKRNTMICLDMSDVEESTCEQNLSAGKKNKVNLNLPEEA